MDLISISENCKRCSQDSFNGNSTKFTGLILLSFTTWSSNKNGWKFALYIDGLNKKPDIIVFSETWLNGTKISKLLGHKSLKSVRTKKKQVVDFVFFLEMFHLSKL